MLVEAQQWEQQGGLAVWLHFWAGLGSLCSCLSWYQHWEELQEKQLRWDLCGCQRLPQAVLWEVTVFLEEVKEKEVNF